MIGKIISIEADLFKVLVVDVVYSSKASKLLQHKNLDLRVGDNVEIEKIDETKAYITKREERKNELIRPNVANIDKAIVCISLKEPDLNLNLLDRFLSVLEYNNIDCSIIFTKVDLVNKLEEVNKIINYYKLIGYECYTSTTKEDSIVDIVKRIISKKIVVITGQSGVGKSSLINLLDPTLNLKTDEISYALNRGRHTTRVTSLIRIGDGWIIDTPGFGNLDFTDMDKTSISQSFREFFKLSLKCKYKGCLHLNEPDCFVKQEVEKGNILKERYQNYQQFMKIVSEAKNKYE